MFKFKAIYTSLLIALTLTGCMQPMRSQTISSKEKRAQYLQQMQNWQAAGRIAINNGAENITASFTWEQNQQQYRIHFYSPFSTETVTITGDEEDFKVVAVNAESQEDLELEQHLPFTHMAMWIRGMVAPNLTPEKLLYDERNQIKTLQQDGWLIEYQSYGTNQPVSLPERLTMTDGHTKAKLLIKSWQK